MTFRGGGVTAQRTFGHAGRLTIVAIGAAAVLAGCGDTTDSGGLKISDRNAAQIAMNSLQTSNIPTTILNMTSTAGQIPAACHIHMISRNPSRFKVYIFWIPYVGPSSYSWLDMTITKDANQDTFHLATAPSVLPGGLGLGGLAPPVPGYNEYDLPLSKLSGQAAINKKVLMQHAGNVFSKPDAPCQVLKNGFLRLLPNP
jgi:hypothetical protein